jgi:putative methionine-R-sulfoxide reductase with GAF domain
MFKLFRKYSATAPLREDTQSMEPAVSFNAPMTDQADNPASLKEKIVDLGSDPEEFSRNLLSFLAKEKEISQGIFFIAAKKGDKNVLRYLSGYAYENEKPEEIEIEFGEGFPGQVASDGKIMNISEIPDGYISIVSGLGKAKPVSMIISPLIYNHHVLGVIELASFHRFTSEDEVYLKEISSYAASHLKKMISKKTK